MQELILDAKILVVDDSIVTRETLVSYFEQEGYQVTGVETAEAAEAELQQQNFDLILLDIRLPGKDGLTLTRELRTQSEIGIILVTGKQDDIDRIIGLECGADEYVVKPFNPREILARCKNLIRRVKKLRKNTKASTQPVFRDVGTWQLDNARRVLQQENSEAIQLTEGEFQLLSTFIDNAESPLTRDQLMNRLKNRAWNATDRSIDVLVGRIRRKLAQDPHCPNLIITVHGIGYLYSPNNTEQFLE
ncbi:response regulator [Marinomonas sp. 15G1-11]|uniref:Response regulator n=1 Tax=Marinomonas phaeophyticola TaxID=3004091 RepID=A0ABT4JRL9_9GAMM|nr:response regulator [Marinomonas sp. 15G1-11]MCZ2721030.1 response regulator [Marinomonas sp. 15G1-11]